MMRIEIDECRACGGTRYWEDCDWCGGEGAIDGDELMEIDPLWYDPEDREPCDQCAGAGGWWHCPHCFRVALGLNPTVDSPHY